MKVIKKYFKVVMCFMAFALCSFLMVFAPTMTSLSVEAAISDYARTINSVKMPKQVDVQKNQGLIVPFLTGSFANNGYLIKVVDPAGYVHTAKITGSKQFDVVETVAQDGNGYFTIVENQGVKVEALTNGNYQVVYVVTTVLSSLLLLNNTVLDQFIQIGVNRISAYIKCLKYG